jgi:N-acetylglutamate synthase-like GNAT family acetyltransferase
MIAGPNQSAPAFSIQSAKPEQASQIRNLIRHSGINPTGLNWQRFLVALTPAGDFIGCGQIKPHADGTNELASLAVEKEWRGRGVARSIIESLLRSHPSGDLYLMCQSNLGPLYEKFGFQALPEAEMPTYFRRVSKLVSVAIILSRAGERLLVMRRPPTGNV